MTPKFWKNAWQKSQTNFTQKKLNPMLINFLKAINTPKNSRAFMLLCFYAFMLLCFYADRNGFIDKNIPNNIIYLYFF